MQVNAINALLISNGVEATAFLVGNGESKKIMISGTLGGDTYLMSVVHVGDQGMTMAIGCNKVLLLSRDGKLFDVSTLPDNNDLDSVFILSQNRSSRAIFAQIDSSNFLGTVSCFPESVTDWYKYFHEIAHQIRRNIKTDEEVITYLTALKNYKDSGANDQGSLMRIRNSESRQMVAEEERGAWAVAISVLREANRLLDIDLGSRDMLVEAERLYEKSLLTYDNVPYPINQHDGLEPIPAFSRKSRTASKRLHDILSGSMLGYEDLQNFDMDTGEPLVADIQKIVDSVIKRLEK